MGPGEETQIAGSRASGTEERKKDVIISYKTSSRKKFHSRWYWHLKESHEGVIFLKKSIQGSLEGQTSPNWAGQSKEKQSIAHEKRDKPFVYRVKAVRSIGIEESVIAKRGNNKAINQQDSQVIMI